MANGQVLVQSLDFFTPVVDDPYTYGQIAASNSLSDIYAVGAVPQTAMNVVGFPLCHLGPEVLAEILKGGAERVREAGAVIVGGHSVEDDEPKYGLSVTGVADLVDLVMATNCRVGDQLVLTKPLGSGILATALKGEVIGEEQMLEAIRSMETLNRAAAEAMLEVGASACTDITGFGLLGHALELAEASRVGLEIDADSLKVYPEVPDLAAIGLVPVGSYHNRQHYLPRVVNGEQLPAELIDILADPQTSGGLLICVQEDKLGQLCQELESRGSNAFVIGRVVEQNPGKLSVRG